MIDKPENPPAFPNDKDIGMTLRDYFAAKVAQGLVAADNTDTPEWVAARSYRIANQLLVERNK